ncbi:MauE/DoxX family redox-associated membrane protein [Hydrotalea flava]|uniref:MauE/DoxX family redox-associated membrane protein n=1 Tax=Hydrotalea flava TaxID=714549 RepID=UPI0008321130|nr:MauE/DoxX family redox-associated membrane protein [Hydrotalea flava]
MNQNIIFKLVYIFSSVLIFVFLYSSLQKIIDFDNFISTLSKSPFLYNKFIKETGIFIILIEIAIVLLLISNRLKVWGFLFAFLVLLLFNGYIILMLVYSPYLPCSCGGFIEELTWRQHIVFNFVLIIFSLCGYFITNVK